MIIPLYPLTAYSSRVLSQTSVGYSR